MIATNQVVALTTAPSEEEASSLSHGLVDQRLAACVQVSSPIRAIYRWNGQVWNEPEWQLWIKTTSDLIDKIDDYLQAEHSGEVHELVVLKITEGSTDYLTWISEETQHPSR